MFKQTIKTNILTIFLVLIGIVSISLLSAQYYFNSTLAKNSTTKAFKLIANNISQQIEKDNQHIHNIIKVNISNENLFQEIKFHDNHSATQDLIQLMSINQGVYSMYFAHKDGSFYEIVNMHESKLLYDLYKAPKETRWTIIVNIKNTTQYIFLNKNQKEIFTYSKNKKYNPLSRTWYKKALASDKTIMTKPYLFSNIGETGTTFAVELSQKGSVFAIDFTMKRLNELLEVQNFKGNSEVFIFNKNGNKLASSIAKVQPIKKEDFHHEASSIIFTKEEKKYIYNLAPLVISNEEDWVPFDFQSNGKPIGYSIDLIKLIAQKSGLKIEFLNGYTWDEIIKNFINKDIDIVHSLYKTKQREKLGMFTNEIYSFKNHFITQKKSQSITSIENLKYKKVGVVKGWEIASFISTNYPDVEIVKFDDLTSSVLALSQNKISAIVETKETFNYISKQLYIDNLVVSGWFKEFDNSKKRSIYMMIQNKNPLLLAILNKTINSITDKEKKYLANKWLLNKKADTNTDMIEPALMDALLKNNTKIISYKHNTDNYSSMYIPLDEGLFLGVKVDTDLLYKPYNENMKYSLIISILLLLIALPIIFYAINIIIKPIKDLIIENNGIKNRRFDNVEKIDTNIIEFIELSDSLVSMASSISEYQKSQEELLNAIVKLIAEAVDAKSPYTGGHCKRVPEIANMLVLKANESDDGIFKDFKLESDDDLREFEIGAWLHDCGKVTTPEHVVDKSTKLETINDRIHEVRTRFEVLWRDAQISFLEAKLNNNDSQEAQEILNKTQEKLIEDFQFIANANIGGEYMSPDKQQRVRDIANQEWIRHFDDSLGLGEIEILRYDKENAQPLPAIEKLLSDKSQHIVKRENFDYESYERDGFKEDVPEFLYNYGEVYNLCIDKGTLSPEERYKINEHVILTIKMLEKIPFPTQMTKIPEYAGTHHETLTGSGYPRKLSENDLSIPARIMALADVFEALTASDRPYKKAKTLSASIKILSFMVKDKHIDKDIFKLFLKNDLHNVYAKKYLKSQQIDEVDISAYI